MTNRWESRTEPEPGQGRLYWHILFRDQPQVAGIASIGQEKLGGFHGLHFTPREWLHITTLVPGLADEFTPSKVESMIAHARQLLSEFPAIQVTLGRVFYHPEAIILSVEPTTLLTHFERQYGRQLNWRRIQVKRRSANRGFHISLWPTALQISQQARSLTLLAANCQCAGPW